MSYLRAPLAAAVLLAACSGEAAQAQGCLSPASSAPPASILQSCTTFLSGSHQPYEMADAHLARAMARLRTQGGGQSAEELNSLVLVDLDRAIEFNPSFFEALNLRAGVLSAMGQSERALSDVNKAMSLRPGQFNLLSTRATIYRELGQWELALADLNEAVRMRPDVWVLYSNRCGVRAEAGVELEIAAQDCDRALRLEPNAAPALYSRGLLSLRRGEYREASRDFSEAYEGSSALTAALYGSGIAKQKLGDDEGGRRDMAAAEAASPRVARHFVRSGLWPSQYGAD